MQLVSASLVSNCMRPSARGIPLYDSAGPVRERNSVSILMGQVTVVDDKPVDSGGAAFELLPGCHVVEIGGRVGRVDPRFGGWVATLRPLTYAFRMRAGHSYSIEVEREPSLGLGPKGNARIIAFDRDPNGDGRAVPSAHNPEDIAACRRWSPVPSAPGPSSR